MKPSTARMLLDVARNVKGIVTIIERWIMQEGRIGEVTVSGAHSGKDNSSPASVGKNGVLKG